MNLSRLPILFASLAVSVLTGCGGGTVSSETFVETGSTDTTTTDTTSTTTTTDSTSSDTTTTTTDPCQDFCGDPTELQASCETLAPGSVLKQCSDVVPGTCQPLPTPGPVTCPDGTEAGVVCCTE